MGKPMTPKPINATFIAVIPSLFAVAGQFPELPPPGQAQSRKNLAAGDRSATTAAQASPKTDKERAAVDDQEILKLQRYLQQLFGNRSMRLKRGRQKGAI